jgi:membrane protein required for colicin V production
VNLVDILTIVVIAVGFLHGTIKGAIQEIAAAVALVVGVMVAGQAASGSAAVTSQLSNPAVGRIFVFVITFIIVAIVIGLLGKLVSNLAKQANLSPIDRILGGVIGACLVGIAAGLIFKIMAITGAESRAVTDSAVAQKLVNAVSYLGRFLPGGAVSASAALVSRPARK